MYGDLFVIVFSLFPGRAGARPARAAVLAQVATCIHSLPLIGPAPDRLAGAGLRWQAQSSPPSPSLTQAHSPVRSLGPQAGSRAPWPLPAPARTALALRPGSTKPAPLGTAGGVRHARGRGCGPAGVLPTLAGFHSLLPTAPNAFARPADLAPTHRTPSRPFPRTGRHFPAHSARRTRGRQEGALAEDTLRYRRCSQALRGASTRHPVGPAAD